MRTKRLLLGLSVGLLLSAGVAWAENEATYNASTGFVNMPKVSAGADYYNVDMAQQGPGLDFLVTYAVPATSSSTENVAIYAANMRSLHIPTVIVGANRYTVDLAQQGPGYNFSVTSAVLQIMPMESSGIIYKHVGSVQCDGGGTSVPAMQQQLTDAGIQIFSADCGLDGYMHVTMCGADDGHIGIFEVSESQAQSVLALGFKPLNTLPDATKVACQ